MLFYPLSSFKNKKKTRFPLFAIQQNLLFPVGCVIFSQCGWMALSKSWTKTIFYDRNKIFDQKTMSNRSERATLLFLAGNIPLYVWTCLPQVDWFLPKPWAFHRQETTWRGCTQREGWFSMQRITPTVHHNPFCASVLSSSKIFRLFHLFLIAFSVGKLLDVIFADGYTFDVHFRFSSGRSWPYCNQPELISPLLSHHLLQIIREYVGLDRKNLAGIISFVWWMSGCPGHLHKRDRCGLPGVDIYGLLPTPSN